MAYKRFKPHVNYVILIDKKYYYIGCTNTKKEYFTRSKILCRSGNPMISAAQKKIISFREYSERVSLLNIVEYDSKEEALEGERRLIKEYKDKYGDFCINKCLEGNAHTNKGCCSFHGSVPNLNGEPIVSIGVKDNSKGWSKASRERLSNSRKGIKFSEEHKQNLWMNREHTSPMKGKHHTDETKRKISESLKRTYDKRKVVNG